MTQLSRGTGCAHRGCPLSVLFMDNCMSVLPQRLVKMPELLDSSIHSHQYAVVMDVRNNSVTQETQEMQVGEADILAGGIWSVLRVNRFSSIYPSRLGARGTTSSCHDCLQQLAASNFADVIPRPSTSPLRFLSAPCGHKDISDFLS